MIPTPSTPARPVPKRPGPKQLVQEPLVPTRLVNIQALRALAALVVLISHWTGIEANHSPDAVFPNLTVFGMFGVDLFFVISGFILIWISEGLASDARTVGRFLYARLARIYPLYWALTLAVLALWFIQPTITEFQASNLKFIEMIFLWPTSQLPLLKVAWTLIHELYFYLIFSLTLFLPRKWRIPALTMWALTLIVGNLVGLGALSPETRLIFNPMGLEFYFGVLCALMIKRTQGSRGSLTLVLGLLLWSLSLGVYAVHGTYALPTDWQRVFLFGIPASLLLYGAVSLELKNLVFPQWGKVIGDWSYSLYLSHVLTLTVLGYLWQKFAGPGWVDNVFALPLMSLGALAVSGMIYTFYERPILRLTKAFGQKIFKEKPAP